MEGISKNCISINDFKDWDKKVVFSPNATGKTRVTNEIKNKYKDEMNVQVFTSKSIGELANTSANDIYIGNSSNKQLENASLVLKYDSSKLFADSLKKHYGTTIAVKLRGISAIFGYFEFTNYKKILDIFGRLESYTNDTQGFDITNYWDIDKILKTSLIKNILKLKRPENLDDSIKTEVSSMVLDSLKNAKEYIDIYKLHKCPLCGESYDSYEELRSIVSEVLSQYTSIEKDNLNNQINDVWIDFKKEYDGNSLIWQYINKEKSISIIDRFTILLSYVNLFSRVVNGFLIEIKILYPNITKDYRSYSTNSNEIELEKKNILNKKDFQENVINRFKELVPLPNNITPQFNKNGVIEIKIDGKSSKPYDVLSDSELKRLSLAVLFASIDYNDVDYLILDDPVDSYDDHYIVKASEYIGRFLVKKPKLKWTIFSHFFDSLFYILNASESLEVEVFLKDPNFIYNPTPNHIPPILKFSISTDAFNTLRDNEIELLRKTMEATATDDLYMQKEFSMLSFFGTFRAIILNINKYYKKSKAFNLVEPRTKKIEGNYLHYNEKTKQTMAELEYIYTKWYNNISPKGYFFTEFVNPLLDLITERTNLINQIGYPNIRCTNPLLKVILFKILSVSESKYLIEKKLIEQMKSNNETLININNVIETHMLGRKINLAMSINSEKYLKFQQLHSKYRNLINDYSHSTIRMVPPYLSMSVYELSQLVSDIDLL